MDPWEQDCPHKCRPKTLFNMFLHTVIVPICYKPE